MDFLPTSASSDEIPSVLVMTGRQGNVSCRIQRLRMMCTDRMMSPGALLRFRRLEKSYFHKGDCRANNNNHTVTGNVKQVLMYVGRPCTDGHKTQ